VTVTAASALTLARRWWSWLRYHDIEKTEAALLSTVHARHTCYTFAAESSRSLFTLFEGFYSRAEKKGYEMHFKVSKVKVLFDFRVLAHRLRL
jgi:hypothetical protein